jgi:protein-L-isoaspartate(D-aspartate) O-methyltransferase
MAGLAGSGQASGATAAGGAETDREASELRGAMAGRIAERHQAMAALFPELREQLGEELPGSVAAALRKVPRHLFTPGVPLAKAYEDAAVVIETDEGSANLSPVSAPSMIAGMLAQLDVRPGQSVLEIGSGGYQAALLRELAGPGGSVTTLDIDPDVVSRARACLDRTGYGDVRTVCADGEYGAPGGGPFDKIIVAVEAWDVPPAWTGQLAPGGRLVVPLLIRGLPRSWALDRRDGHLVGRSDLGAFFVPMRGAAGEYREWSVPVDEGVSLWGEEHEPDGLDRAALAGVLAAERCEARTGVTVPMDKLPMDKLATRPDLWLVTGPDLCWLNVSMDALDRGLVAPMGSMFRSGRVNTPALASSGSLAYYSLMRPVDGDRTAVEFGAYGHGPLGAELAERLAAHIQAWDRDHRAGPAPLLTVHRAATPAEALPSGHVMNKRHSTFVLSWPESSLLRKSTNLRPSA